jgi:predicted XRE-type DNA-binding protein
MSKQSEFIQGSGNIFADLGVEDAEMELAKAELAYLIRSQIRMRKLTQKQAASLLETDQAKISAVMNGKVSGYTYDRLVHYLNKLSCDVTLVVTPSETVSAGKVRVETASH